MAALEFVEKSLAEGYKDIIIEAPTGFGKTAVGATLCRWLSGPTNDALLQPGGYMLVVQKALQDQIAADLGRFGSGGFSAHLIKSAIEYNCPAYKCCGLAVKPCPMKKSGNCTYKIAKNRFLGSVLGVTNYAYYLTDAAYVKSMMTRCVMVLDEAHNLESTLTSLVGIELSLEKLQKRNKDLAEEMTCLGSSIDNFIDWLGNRYLPETYERVQTLLEMASDTGTTDAEAREFAEAKQEYERVLVTYGRLQSDPSGWVYWRDTNERTKNFTLICKPIDIGPYFHDYFDRFPRRVFMSAFIGGKDVFCRSLHLDPAKVAHYKVDSDFDKSRRLVHLLNAGSLSRSNKETTLPRALNLVIRIVRQHATERGIIHTHSYAIAEEVANCLRNAGFGERLTYPEKMEDREEALLHHAATPGSILISPSVFEGFDFAYDLCRWQIVVKAQFSSMGDEVVKARMARDPHWYRMEAAKKFVQTCGRGMRAKDDTCTTYVLDSDITRLLSDTRGELPQWFLEAIDNR